MLGIHLLGLPRIELQGSPVYFDTRKAIALLAYVAVTGEAHGRDSLAAMLWPESDDLRARAALRRTLSALKGAIGGDLLRADRTSVGLNLESDIWLDVAEFDAKVQAEDLDSRTLEEAAALYRGDFMAGLLLRDSPDFDDWQMLTSQRLQRTLATVLETLVRHCSAREEFERAIAHARRWSSLDPMHEAAHRSLMDLYARSGQRSAALRQYRDCVRILESELGVPPLAETTAVYDAIKENRLNPVRPDSSDGGGATTAAQARPDETEADFPFVGRSDELKQVLGRHDSLGSDGHLFIVEGEMGVGKTRLAKEVAAQVRGQGGTVLGLRCYEGESNVAYGPIVECLRTIATQPGLVAALGSLEGHLKSELARLVPDFQGLWSDLPDIRSLSEPGAQSHLLESVSRALVEVVGRRGLVFIDDLQWLDAASLDVMSYLVRRLQGGPLLVLGTWRTEDVPVDHRLRELLTETQRSGFATSLNLRRLTQQDVSEILDVVPAGRSVADVRSAVYAETEGLPLFVVEYLKVVRSGPVESDGALPMPPTVRNVLRSRINTVSEGARQLLSAAAVVERSFDYETIRNASGRSEAETVTSLEELAARSLLVEVDDSDSTSATYEFSHQRLRELVYQETSLARRRLLHRRVAESLERRSGGGRDRNELASQIAHHYQSAGHEAKAADYHKIAGEHARTLFANEEALVHLNSALAFNHPDVAELHESVGDLQTLMGDYGSAISSYETAAATTEVGHVSRLEHKLGNVHQRRGDLDLAQSHYESAAGMMDETLSPSAVSRVYSDASLNAYQRGELDQAKALGREALDLAEKSEVAEALAQAHNVLGILQKSTGELDSSATQLEKSLAYARKLDDRAVELAALNNLALCQAASGRVDEAVETEKTALQLCDLIGDRHREAAIRNNLADLYHLGGFEDKAMEELKRAVAIFADIGSRGAETRPEIWKLVEW